MIIENVLSGLQNQGLSDQQIRLIEEVIEQIKTDETPSNMRNF